METIVVFANSVKHGQHCVAGKSLSTGQWVRPVADANGRELDHEQAKYRNPYGRYLVKPLQKINMVLGANVPLPHQPENYLITNREWLQNYNITPNEVPNFLDSPVNLWGHGHVVDASMINLGFVTIQQSLYLIHAPDLSLYRNDENKRRIVFSYNGENYDLPVTDPNFDALLSGEKKNHGFICASLGEEYNGRHYKIVVAIL